MDSGGGNKCFFCGASIAGDVFAKGGEHYCCEGCFLKQVKLERADVSMHLAIVEALVEALDMREHETGLHSKRVACHTLVLARHFYSDRDVLHQIYWGSLLHDIGKIGVPDAILLKQGPLTEDEWLMMRTHPEKGRNIVMRIPFLAEAAQIVFCHEERFDGGGYPQGMAGDAIPLGARIFSVIDALDAITSDRPYRKGLSFESAKAEIVNNSGIQFDPRVVEVFLMEEKEIRRMVDLKCGKALFQPAQPEQWYQ